MRLATYASVSVACVLIALKTGAWIATESIAMLSTLVDSLLDALASIVSLVAVRHALTPADQEHRFGHGKAEALAAMAQSAFIAGSSVLLLFQAGERFIHPRPLARPETGIWVMVISIVLTIALVAFQLWVVRRTKSVAVAADSLHYKGDILVNIAVIAALVLGSWFGWLYADPIFGTAIAVYILYNAWLIVREALDMLMDRELPDDERQRIREIALAHAEVREPARHAHQAFGPDQLHPVPSGNERGIDPAQGARGFRRGRVGAAPGLSRRRDTDPPGSHRDRSRSTPFIPDRPRDGMR